MIFSLNQSNPTIPACNSHISDHRRLSQAKFLVLPPLSTPKIKNFSKPLHLFSVQNLGLLTTQPRIKIPCKAYEANRSAADGELIVEKVEAARKAKIGVYFATWWFLNVIFNIYNKKVLNAFPYPWLTSLLSLAAGSTIMLISWGTKVAEAPNTDLEFWKSLFPVALAHTIGHVAATVSMSKVAVSFTHIIKSGEPAFSVLVSRFILGETFPTSVYLSLLPIIGGCGLAALTELNFNMIGFMGAMISNLAFVFRNIFSKKGMKGKSVSGMNYYACLSLLSLLILTPFAIAVEGPKMWAAGWQNAVSEIGPHFIWVALAHTIGHVAATVSMSKVAVSFTHIIKSGEPAFSVLVSRFILGETFPTSVYLSLLPIIGGCGLAALTELNFNMIGFMGAMISNLAFVFRNIFSKKGMKGKSVSGMNYYACLSLLSLLILTPFAIAVEGPKMWAAGWQNAVSEIGPHFIWWVAAQSIFYHLYNQVSYMSLDEISPLTFSIGNTMKRISVIVSSIIIFRTPVQPVNALGAAIAIFGTFLYSQAKQ